MCSSEPRSSTMVTTVKQAKILLYTQAAKIQLHHPARLAILGLGTHHPLQCAGLGDTRMRHIWLLPLESTQPVGPTQDKDKFMT